MFGPDPFVLPILLFVHEGRIIMLNKKSVDDLKNLKGRRVLVRCDFNVPLKNGVITDETRIVAALPTIKKLIADGGKVILCSHLGKPKGPDKAFSLAPVAKRLSELLGQEVKFAADDTVVGDNARAAVEAMNDGDVILLENTRFRAEETKNGEEFSKDLASIADVFVNDAFGTAHRAHCSNVGVTKYVDTAVVGYLMQKEIDFLGNAVNNPVRPFVASLRSNIHTHIIIFLTSSFNYVERSIVLEFLCYYCINRNKHLNALLFSLSHHFLSVVKIIIFN